MARADDELWRAAQARPWTKRPLKTDVVALAGGVAPADDIEGVYRISWSTTAGGAVAITSRSLLIGAARPGQHLQEVLHQVAPEFRLGSTGIAVPRRVIRHVVVAAQELVVHTDRQAIVIPAAAGASRDIELERALLHLDRAPLPAPAVPGDGTSDATRRRRDEARRLPHDAGLWNSRYQRDGRIQINRRRPHTPRSGAASSLASAGRFWRELPTWAQWGLAVGAYVPLHAVAALAGLAFVGLLLGFLWATGPAGMAKRQGRVSSAETELAEADWIESRVAGAACRAWEETLQEPSWSSPALSATRAAFDGDGEVDAIIDLALRIRAARRQLGPMPTGPAISIWQEQWRALDAAARRLGERADALIRHRDQAARLSRELADLAELERLERSALVVDDLTIATSVQPEHYRPTSVADQIAAARGAVRELVELMTRTRAPLAAPIERP